MKVRHHLLVGVIIWAAAASALAWGDDGHKTIGAMADALIAETDAAAHVRDLLGGESLSAASVWADQVKGRTNQTPEMLDFKAANLNHSFCHFTDIPFEESSYRDSSIGASSTDVVHAIPACILILQGKPAAQTLFTNVTQRVALRLLAHYIEDIHQPLHVGTGYLEGIQFVDPNNRPGRFADDQGANRLVFGGTNKLHFFWDITVVQLNMLAAGAETPQQYAATLLARPPPEWRTTSPMLEWDRVWADECLPLSAKAHDVTVLYEDDSQWDYRTGKPRPLWHIKDLSASYIDWSRKVAEDQMTKAGYRLAATLKAIWP